MAKVVDITEKLNFEEKPVIKIKNTEIKVNNSAETMLKIMGTFQNKSETEAISEATSLLFDKKEKEKLDKLNLSFKDYNTVISTAIDLIQGEDGEEGGEE